MRAAESRALFSRLSPALFFVHAGKNRVTFFLRMLPFFGGKVLSNFFPREKEAVAFLQQVLGKSNIGTKRKEKVKFFGVRSIHLPRKTLSFSCSGILLSVVLL